MVFGLIGRHLLSEYVREFRRECIDCIAGSSLLQLDLADNQLGELLTSTVV